MSRHAVVDQPSDVLLHGHVGRDERDTLTQRCRGVLAQLAVASAEDDLRAGVGEHSDDGTSDASRATGDQGDPPVQAKPAGRRIA